MHGKGALLPHGIERLIGHHFVGCDRRRAVGAAGIADKEIGLGRGRSDALVVLGPTQERIAGTRRGGRYINRLVDAEIIVRRINAAVRAAFIVIVPVDMRGGAILFVHIDRGQRDDKDRFSALRHFGRKCTVRDKVRAGNIACSVQFPMIETLVFRPESAVGSGRGMDGCLVGIVQRILAAPLRRAGGVDIFNMKTAESGNRVVSPLGIEGKDAHRGIPAVVVIFRTARIIRTVIDDRKRVARQSGREVPGLGAGLVRVPADQGVILVQGGLTEIGVVQNGAIGNPEVIALRADVAAVGIDLYMVFNRSDLGIKGQRLGGHDSAGPDKGLCQGGVLEPADEVMAVVARVHCRRIAFVCRNAFPVGNVLNRTAGDLIVSIHEGDVVHNTVVLDVEVGIAAPLLHRVAVGLNIGSPPRRGEGCACAPGISGKLRACQSVRD